LSKIKTRETVKDVKVLDKAAVASQRMKDAFVRTKDQAENLMDDGQITPSEYAEDKIQYAAEDMVNEAGHTVSSSTKKAVNKGKEAYRQHREIKKAERAAENPASSARQASAETQRAAQTQRTAQTQRAVRTHAQRNVSNAKQVRNQTIKTSRQAERTIKQTAKSTGRATAKTAKGTVKTAQKSVKTAEKTSKAAIKTAQATAKATQKAAQASAKAAKVAAQAARAAAKAAVVTAKAVAKAVVAAVKAIIAGIKALVAAIAAGGWVAVVVIVVICLIALIVGSCFGIFFSSEDTGGQPMTEVVREINTEYENKLEDTKAAYTHDVLEMSGSRAVWKEVLSVYAVKTTTDPDNPQEVASMDDGKKTLLKEIFWAMNQISARTETKTETQIVESDDGNGNIVEEEVEVTQVYLYITVTHKSADEMADAYGFNADQREQLAALLDDENNSMWTAVLYGITGTDEQIVAVALSQVGNVGGQPYWSWYGFNSRVEWCACFVSWCANECGYIENGIIPKYAGCVWGVQWFRERGQWADNSIEPTPGMIIFFDWDSPNGSSGPQDGQSDHTGIVARVEDGRVWTVEGNSRDSCREKSYPLGYYEILGYGIPAY
jgi:hypothetical protein